MDRLLQHLVVSFLYQLLHDLESSSFSLLLSFDMSSDNVQQHKNGNLSSMT